MTCTLRTSLIVVLLLAAFTANAATRIDLGRDWAFHTDPDGTVAMERVLASQ